MRARRGLRHLPCLSALFVEDAEFLLLTLDGTAVAAACVPLPAANGVAHTILYELDFNGNVVKRAGADPILYVGIDYLIGVLWWPPVKAPFESLGKRGLASAVVAHDQSDVAIRIS